MKLQLAIHINGHYSIAKALKLLRDGIRQQALKREKENNLMNITKLIKVFKHQIQILKLKKTHL